MAFVEGLEGLLSATGSTDLAYLIGTSTKPYSASISVVRESLDSTGFGATPPIAKSMISGVSEWSGSFTAKFPKSAPASGHEGLVTFGSGYVLGCRAWSISATASEHDETGLSASPPTWKGFASGLYSFSGSFDVQVDDTTALAGMTEGAATFRLSTDTNDNELAASNIIITGRSLPITVDGKSIVQYSFVVDGNLTTDGDGSFLQVAAAGTPDLLVRPESTAITLRASGSRTYTGNAFTTGWTVGASMGSPIEATVNFRGTGALTDN